MNFEIKWEKHPFPYAVIDNLLPLNKFNELQNSLNTSKLEVLSTFNTKIENKTIFKANTLPNKIKETINLLSGKTIKDSISSRLGGLELLSLSDTNNFSGYSPLHSTSREGCLGSHIDHSSIENDKYKHIANTIFYASNKWEEKWGGETILFSRNGFRKVKLIEPRPNRLIIFIHTANSFHGVTNYTPKDDTPRLTFYNDYYIKDSEILFALNEINKNRKKPLTHSFHSTTFIPLAPFGIKSFKINNLFEIRSLKYLIVYIVYLINKIFRTKLSIKKLNISRFFPRIRK